MRARTPAQLYALVVGIVLTVGGIVGFFYSTSFGSPGHVHRLFGIFEVNGWLNLLHLATGLLGLLALGYGARAYALAMGVAYVVLGIWSLGVFPLNTPDRVLHLALGALGLVASRSAARRPRARREASTARA